MIEGEAQNVTLFQHRRGFRCIFKLRIPSMGVRCDDERRSTHARPFCLISSTCWLGFPSAAINEPRASQDLSGGMVSIMSGGPTC